jgi:hypothetical protein
METLHITHNAQEKGQIYGLRSCQVKPIHAKEPELTGYRGSVTHTYRILMSHILSLIEVT